MHCVVVGMVPFHRHCYHCIRSEGKLQTLVCNILPSTTAVFSYSILYSIGIGSRKLSANEQFFCWSSNSSKFVTTQIISDICFMLPCCLHQLKSQIKPKSFELRWNFFFNPGWILDVSHVYVCAWALGCFHNLISNQTF